MPDGVFVPRGVLKLKPPGPRAPSPCRAPLGSFIIGLVVFGGGAAINIWADHTLIGLRSGGKQGYTIPRGGLFEWVSCPNHIGEIIQWSGFALMCWNLPSLSFAVWTAANLIPRTLAHHAWYRRTFPDYPQDRCAVIPALLQRIDARHAHRVDALVVALHAFAS